MPTTLRKMERFFHDDFPYHIVLIVQVEGQRRGERECEGWGQLPPANASFIRGTVVLRAIGLSEHGRKRGERQAAREIS